MLDGKWLDMRIEYVRDKIESFGIYWDLLRSSWTLDLYPCWKTLHHSLSQHVVEWLDGAAAVSVLKQRPWWLRHGQRWRDDYYELLGIRSTATAKVGETGREKEGEPPVLSSFNNGMFIDIFRMFMAILWHMTFGIGSGGHI